MAEPLSDILARLVPDEADALLGRVLGGSFRRRGDGGRHRVLAVGVFRGFLTEWVLAWASHPRLQTALVVVDDEHERALFFSDGQTVSAVSNVLFECLGRILYKRGIVTREDAEALIVIEEKEGPQEVMGWVPDDVLQWAVERRVREVVAALPYVARGAFVLVEGEAPLRGLPATAFDPAALAAEARLLYDAWREGTSQALDDAGQPTAVPAAVPGPLRPPRTREEEVQDILRRVREADLRLE